MSDEDDLFGKAMRDVRRIQTESRRVVETKKPCVRRDVHAGRVLPLAQAAPMHRPGVGEEPWILKADGVSAGRLRQLAAGRPPADAETDLHGMTREEMYRALSGVLEHALHSGYRVLCLVHGRGLHSDDARPVLKEAVYAWLRDGPYAGWVLAVIPRPGTGGGSALLLLRRRR